MFLKPEEFLSTLKNSFDGCDEVYKSGSCYQLYTILKSVFPRSECYLSLQKDHVITKIDNKYYDIDGEVEFTNCYKQLDKMKNYNHQTMKKTVFSIYGLNVISSENINKWDSGEDKSLIKYPDVVFN